MSVSVSGIRPWPALWSPDEKARHAPAACIRAPVLPPGEGQATFQCREESLSHRGTECLFEVGQDVVNVLNTNGQRQWTGVSWPALWSPAEKVRRAPAACIPSHGAARPGEGQATFQSREESLSRRGTECLFEVGQDVVNVLNTNGQAHHFLRYPAGQQLLSCQLAVRCGGWMTGQRACISKFTRRKISFKHQ